MRLNLLLLAAGLVIAPQSADLPDQPSTENRGREVVVEVEYTLNGSEVDAHSDRRAERSVEYAPGGRRAAPGVESVTEAGTPGQGSCWRVWSGRIPEELGECEGATDDPVAADPDDAADAPQTFTITVSDLARFAPREATTVVEPFGIGVVGLPTNFVAPSSVHVVSGELFGHPVQVRFMPTGYVFTHGDGTRTNSASPGRSWDDLGVPQFTRTDTSHVYMERGEYTVSTVVQYTAEVDFGGGWVAVPGILEIPTAGTPVQVYEVRNALVEHDCIEDPTGPGC